MEDFLNDFDCWFKKKYYGKPVKRYWTFKAALNLFLQRGGKNIVETGTVRQKKDWSGGMSTLIFGEVCYRYDRHLWTVDHNPKALEVSKEVTAKFKDAITYVERDSIRFLSDFPKPIDLLYLDSLDCPEDPYKDPIPAQMHQLNELKAAFDKLSKGAVILLDDNDFISGGKTRLAKEFLREQGWTVVLDYRQSLFIK